MFKTEFIKSISSHELAKLKGLVLNVDGMIAKVNWVNGNGPMHVLVKNLTRTNNIYGS